LRQPVHADELARLAVGLLAAADMPAIESPVGGGSVLTYRDMVARTLSAAGLAPRILAVPAGLLAGLAGALSWLPGAAGLNAGFVRRQAVDMVFDDTRLRAELAYQPRPFAPAPEDFTVPERARTLQPWP
jgi:nucleoside-diphosphate-sugar epimerase